MCFGLLYQIQYLYFAATCVHVYAVNFGLYDVICFDMLNICNYPALGHNVVHLKPRSHLAEYICRLFTIEINSAIANNLKTIGMMKMQCVTSYPIFYECVSDYMKIHHDRF